VWILCCVWMIWIESGGSIFGGLVTLQPLMVLNEWIRDETFSRLLSLLSFLSLLLPGRHTFLWVSLWFTENA
jgi:hypothetical protein